MAIEDDIDLAAKKLKNNEFIFVRTSIYPPHDENLNLNSINYLKKI